MACFDTRWKQKIRCILRLIFRTKPRGSRPISADRTGGAVSARCVWRGSDTAARSVGFGIFDISTSNRNFKANFKESRQTLCCRKHADVLELLSLKSNLSIRKFSVKTKLFTFCGSAKRFGISKLSTIPFLVSLDGHRVITENRCSLAEKIFALQKHE